MHVFVFRLYFYKDVLVIGCWVVYFYSLNIQKYSIFIQASFHEFTVSQELNVAESGMLTEHCVLPHFALMQQCPLRAKTCI